MTPYFDDLDLDKVKDFVEIVAATLHTFTFHHFQLKGRGYVLGPCY
jgi:hypothetical protein